MRLNEIDSCGPDDGRKCSRLRRSKAFLLSDGSGRDKLALLPIREAL